MKYIFRIIIFTCFAIAAKAQQKPVYDQTRTDQVLANRAMWAKYFQSIPHGTTPVLPAYVPDSVKCGALYFKTTAGDTALYVYNCLKNAWQAVGNGAALAAEKAARQTGDNNLRTAVSQDSLRGVNNANAITAEAATARAAEATKVPATRQVNGHALSADVIVTKSDVGLANADNTSDVNKPVSTAQQTALNLKANLSLISAANGIASLDGNGKVPISQINDALLGSVNYQGGYNAATSTPTLPAAASSNKGLFWIVTTAGSYSGLTLNIGDWIISNGSAYTKVDNNNAVVSVNYKTGAVILTTSDIPEGVNLYFTNARAIGALLTGFTSGAGTVAPSDNILQALQKINGNQVNDASAIATKISQAQGDARYAPITGSAVYAVDANVLHTTGNESKTGNFNLTGNFGVTGILTQTANTNATNLSTFNNTSTGSSANTSLTLEANGQNAYMQFFPTTYTAVPALTGNYVLQNAQTGKVAILSTDYNVHNFDIDNSGNTTIRGTVTAAKHITSGATSSQFVKGDGSLDGTGYINTSTDQLSISGSKGFLNDMFHFNGLRSVYANNADPNNYTGIIVKSTGIQAVSVSGGVATAVNQALAPDGGDLYYNDKTIPGNKLVKTSDLSSYITSSYTGFDSRYVKKSGDSMTGGLILSIPTGSVGYQVKAGSGGNWQIGPNSGAGTTDDSYSIYSATYGVGHGSFPLLTFSGLTGVGAFTVSPTAPGLNLNPATATIYGTVSGSAVCSMPFQGAGYKKVIIRLNNFQGGSSSSSYSYPTSFVSQPSVVGGSLLFRDNFSWGSTSITLNGLNDTAYTGWIILEGY